MTAKIIALIGLHILGHMRADARKHGIKLNVFNEFDALHHAAEDAGATKDEIIAAWCSPGYDLPWQPPTS